MKKITRVLCMAFSFLLILSCVTACGEKEKKNEKGIVGVWEYTNLDTHEKETFEFCEDGTYRNTGGSDRSDEIQLGEWKIAEKTLQLRFQYEGEWSDWMEYRYDLDGDEMTLWYDVPDDQYHVTMIRQK